MVSVDEGLLSKVAARIAEPPGYADEGTTGSILTVAAAAYSSGARPVEDTTQPTGFDPQAAALFEAVLEGAFLVANSDGHFDHAERQAFRQVILTACHGKVTESQVDALLADLKDQLDEDGIDKRIEMVARAISREDHKKEVLRISALLARVSAGVSEHERSVLERLSDEFGLDRSTVAQALTEVERALSD